MHFLNICTLLALLQGSTLAVVVTPKCNADNCLRGLFGQNARSSSANMAACSTGLPTVTISIDGTSRTTMTGTAAPPAAATVCDGQGIARRAARFQSACSCVGVFPSTVTASASLVASSTVAQTVSETASQTTAAPAQITIGQAATALDLLRGCGARELIQDGRGTVGNSYTVPQAGQIVSASMFDTRVGGAVFQVWRPASGTRIYELVGKSEILALTGARELKSFSFQAITVQAGDLLGMRSNNAGCAIVSTGSTGLLGNVISSSEETGIEDEQQFEEEFPGNLLNLMAILE